MPIPALTLSTTPNVLFSVFGSVLAGSCFVVLGFASAVSEDFLLPDDFTSVPLSDYL